MKFVDSEKYFNPPPRVFYATGRSKAVVPVFFLNLRGFVVYTTHGE